MIKDITCKPVVSFRESESSSGKLVLRITIEYRKDIYTKAAIDKIARDIMFTCRTTYRCRRFGRSYHINNNRYYHVFNNHYTEDSFFDKLVLTCYRRHGD